MRFQMEGRWRAILGVIALGAISAMSACSNPNAFQPLTYGAKPWTPPPGWDPQPGPGGQPGCPAGYYIAIRSCEGCKDISYALCDAAAFTQCVCGGPMWKYPTGSDQELDRGRRPERLAAALGHVTCPPF